jgi:hypothetical protein
MHSQRMLANTVCNLHYRARIIFALSLSAFYTERQRKQPPHGRLSYIVPEPGNWQFWVLCITVYILKYNQKEYIRSGAGESNACTNATFTNDRFLPVRFKRSFVKLPYCIVTVLQRDRSSAEYPS